MRVISGKYKGKKILEPKDSKTRPLKDLTKESIFNILSHSNKIKVNLLNFVIPARRGATSNSILVWEKPIHEVSPLINFSFYICLFISSIYG